jgi:hypothetical protein
MHQVLTELPALTAFSAIAFIFIHATRLGAERRLARGWIAGMTLLAVCTFIGLTLLLRMP